MSQSIPFQLLCNTPSMMNALTGKKQNETTTVIKFMQPISILCLASTILCRQFSGINAFAWHGARTCIMARTCSTQSSTRHVWPLQDRSESAATSRAITIPHRDTSEATGGQDLLHSTLIHLDHMNDHRGYIKTMSKWVQQHTSLQGVVFLPLHCHPRPRHIFILLEEPISNENSATQDFLKRLRSQNVDVNQRGQPCKERMSTVVTTLSVPKSNQTNEQQQLNNELLVVETNGSRASQSHMPFVRDWISQHRPNCAKALIMAMDNHLDVTTKPGKRR